MRSRYVVLTGREGGPQDRIFLGDRLARALGLRRGDAVRVEGRGFLTLLWAAREGDGYSAEVPYDAARALGMELPCLARIARIRPRDCLYARIEGPRWLGGGALRGLLHLSPLVKGGRLVVRVGGGLVTLRVLEAEPPSSVVTLRTKIVYSYGAGGGTRTHG